MKLYSLSSRLSVNQIKNKVQTGSVFSEEHQKLTRQLTYMLPSMLISNNRLEIDDGFWGIFKTKFVGELKNARGKALIVGRFLSKNIFFYVFHFCFQVIFLVLGFMNFFQESNKISGIIFGLIGLFWPLFVYLTIKERKNWMLSYIAKVFDVVD